MLNYRYINPTVKIFVNDKRQVVGESNSIGSRCRVVDGGVWNWDMERVVVSVDEGYRWMLTDLLNMLASSVLCQEVEDVFDWEVAAAAGFSVKSCT
ncbi:unnamed protein product [Vicia faba]|uniref:Uncharacterized protein n=1 Tax=Vicia faba TaxID=3906 RepID=A0AAV0ZS48_VICFA|nr:unnamed protein product [Vicia faba]